jgi:hypothetical protein
VARRAHATTDIRCGCEGGPDRLEKSIETAFDGLGAPLEAVGDIYRSVDCELSVFVSGACYCV